MDDPSITYKKSMVLDIDQTLHLVAVNSFLLAFMMEDKQ
jgi:hypothetical protein